MKTLILGQEDVHDVVRRVGVDAVMREMIDRLQAGFATHDPARTEIPMRTGFTYDEPTTGLLEWMPLMRRGERVVLKVVGYHTSNGPVRGLPTILSTFSMYDPHTGHLEALVDGTLLTAIRTGAASAVATRLLASPESRTVGLIGCGAQAVTQLHALMRVRDLDRVLICDIDESAMATFPARVAGVVRDGLAIERASIDEIVETVDVLCTATSIDVGAGPLFDDRETRPWLHVNAVGSDFPGKVELPAELLRRSLVTPDSLEQAVHEGECQRLSSDEIGPEVYRIAADADAFVDRQMGPTVFDSTGWALEDAIGMEFVVEAARRYGIGTEMELESIGSDPRHPYEGLRLGVIAEGRG